MNPLSNQSVGVGLRRELIDDFLQDNQTVDFIEISPENWLGFGGRHRKILDKIAEKSPISLHGLSLSIGGIKPLDKDFLKQIQQFMKNYPVMWYSEHLSYTDDGGYLYDLMPIPMTLSAVKYVADRIMQVQDIIGQRLVIENVSTYVMPNAEMSEHEFVKAVIDMADCELLLDVNNVYVNSINHQTDAETFIQAMPSQKIRYLHIAGHEKINDNLLIDTHGTQVNQEVWQLLRKTYQLIGIKPTLLERDFNVPRWADICQEIQIIQQIQQNFNNYD